MIYNFLVNSHTGNGKAKKTMDKLASFLDTQNLKYKVFLSKYAGHLGQLASSLENLNNNIIIVGGDGSLNEVLNGLKDPSSVILGIIPAGTGNDFAKSANINLDPIVAMQDILASNIQYIDYLQTTDSRAINTISTGIDIAVINRYNKKKRQTKGAYFRAVIRSLIGFKCASMSCFVDNAPKGQANYLVVVASNGKYFGGNMKISPNSQINDGKLNFVSIKKLPFYKVPFALLGFKKGKHINKPYTTHSLCDRVVCKHTSDQNVTVNYDGELKHNSVFDVSVVPKGIRLYMTVVNQVGG